MGSIAPKHHVNEKRNSIPLFHSPKYAFEMEKGSFASNFSIPPGMYFVVKTDSKGNYVRTRKEVIIR